MLVPHGHSCVQEIFDPVEMLQCCMDSNGRCGTTGQVTAIHSLEVENSSNTQDGCPVKSLCALWKTECSS